MKNDVGVSPWSTFYPNDVKLLSNDVDFDTLRTNGKWLVNASHNGGHKPMTGSGWLTVCSLENGDVLQEYTHFYGTVSCARTHSEGTWYSWRNYSVFDLGVYDVGSDVTDEHNFAYWVWMHCSNLDVNTYMGEPIHYRVNGVWENHTFFRAEGLIRGTHRDLSIYTAYFFYQIYEDGGSVSWENAIKHYVPDYASKEGIVLAEGTDFNYVIVAGTYIIIASYSYQNNPLSSGQSGWLKIMKVKNDMSQVVCDISGRELYCRYGYNDFSASPWQTI